MKRVPMPWTLGLWMRGWGEEIVERREGIR
jgi:hypothetical protein